MVLMFLEISLNIILFYIISNISSLKRHNFIYLFKIFLCIVYFIYNFIVAMYAKLILKRSTG